MRDAVCSRFVLAGLALLFGGSAARAEFIAWNFHTVATPTLVVSDNHPLGSVHFINTAGRVIGPTHLNLANLLAVSNAPYNVPDQFTSKRFSIDVFITDTDSKQTQKATFSGAIDGADSLYSSLLTFRLTSPAVQRLHLGHHWYYITLDSLTPPGPPSSAAAGSIGATVLVLDNPEPSGLLLAATAGVGLAGWWRGRRAPRERRCG